MRSSIRGIDTVGVEDGDGVDDLEQDLQHSVQVYKIYICIENKFKMILTFCLLYNFASF